jgi:hypothetical protein
VNESAGLSIGEAAEERTKSDHRAALLWRFDVEETAVVLKVAPGTVMRDSRLAKAWLARELAGGRRRDA